LPVADNLDDLVAVNCTIVGSYLIQLK